MPSLNVRDASAVTTATASAPEDSAISFVRDPNGLVVNVVVTPTDCTWPSTPSR